HIRCAPQRSHPLPYTTLFRSFKIRTSAVWVHDRAIVGTGHGIDGEVAPEQVGFQGHVGTGVERETAIAVPRLAFGSRQGVFLVGDRKSTRLNSSHVSISYAVL